MWTLNIIQGLAHVQCTLLYEQDIIIIIYVTRSMKMTTCNESIFSMCLKRSNWSELK